MYGENGATCMRCCAEDDTKPHWRFYSVANAASDQREVLAQLKRDLNEVLEKLGDLGWVHAWEVTRATCQGKPWESAPEAEEHRPECVRTGDTHGRRDHAPRVRETCHHIARRLRDNAETVDTRVGGTGRSIRQCGCGGTTMDPRRHGIGEAHQARENVLGKRRSV